MVLAYHSWKNNLHTSIITAYRPSSKVEGPNSVYQQQLRYLTALQINQCPIKLWFDGLAQLIQKKMKEGHEIILMADANDNVKSSAIRSWATKIGLEEAVSKTTSKDIPTHQRGSKPIDGIFLSHSLTSSKAGYLPFGEFQSDHRALWVDIHQDLLLGFKLPPIISPNARRLQCNVPHICQQWIQLYLQFLNQHHLIERQFTLESSINEPKLTPSQQAEYESILKLRSEGIRFAENKCRKLRVRNVPFSPELQKARYEIELWKAAFSIKTKQKYSSSNFRRLEKKTGIFHVLKQSKDSIKKGESDSFKKYWKLKSQAENLRQSFIHKKAESTAEDTGLTTDNVYKQLLTRESQRLDNRQIKCVLKKLERASVTTVEADTSYGTTIELTDRKSIESACINENYSKYTHTESTICMNEPLKSLLGRTGDTPFCQRILDGTATFPTGTPQYTREFFQQMKCNPSAASQPLNLCIDK